MIEFNEFSVLLLELNSPNYSLAILLKCITQTSKYIVRTPSFCRGSWAFNQIFENGALTRPQLLEGVRWEKGDDFFQGEGIAMFT